MQRDTFLIGAGQTPFGEHWNKGIRELMDDAVDKAIEAAPCSALDIDCVIVANMLGESLSNQAHIGAIAAALLPHHPPALRVESACASGAVALHTAIGLLESGRAETVLVVGVEKMTDASTDHVAAALMGAADAERDLSAGLTFPGIFGLVATRYMYEHGLSREDLSLVSSIHHQFAKENPYAQFRSAVSSHDVSKSTLVADPLRLLDCSPISDGAAAVILSTKHKSSMRIAATQLATDSVSLADRPTITSFAATREAMHSALAESDVRREQIDHLELHDCFSIAAVINLEDLGFFEPGKGVDYYRNPEAYEFTVNRSGGLKGCGHPVAATGIKQMIDVCKQLERSGKHYGLTQNVGGACATCAVHIVEHRAAAGASPFSTQ